MLAEIDKDARAIAVLQEENKALKMRMDQIQQTLDEWALRKEAVLLVDASGTPIELEPVTQFAGRAIFKIPKTVRECVVNKSLRLMRVWYNCYPSIYTGQNYKFPEYKMEMGDRPDPIMSYKDDSEEKPRMIEYRLCFQGELLFTSSHPLDYKITGYSKVYLLVEAI